MYIRKIILSCILIFGNYVAQAQLSFQADTVSYVSFPADGGMHLLYDSIYNNSSSAINITWQKVNEQLPNGWTIASLCDHHLCYNNSESTHGLSIPANSTSYIYTNLKAQAGSTGCAYVQIKINWPSSNEQVLTYIHTTASTLGSCDPLMPSGTENLDSKQDLTLYLNSSNQLQIKNPINQKFYLQLYDLLGRKVEEQTLLPQSNSSFNLPCAASTLYLVKILNSQHELYTVKKFQTN
jgi:hypothetical protein